MSSVVDRSLVLRAELKVLQRYLKRDDITEIAINKPGAVWVEDKDGWHKHEDSMVTYDYLLRLGTAAAVYAGDNIVFENSHPVLSVELPDGERAQFVMPPACKSGSISLTIRKISRGVIGLDSYEKSGFFNRIHKPDSANPTVTELTQIFQSLYDGTVEHQAHMRAYFLKRCVQLKQTIVIAGETGSGKTTFMKSLMQCIPTSERIITIEDVPELVYGLPNHENLVNLFYPSEAIEQSTVTAASLMRSCLRMKPDRILLAELRGGETYDFLNVCLSGHGGSITSCHAGSCRQVFDYLALKVLQSSAGRQIPYEIIGQLLHQVIDVVVHVHRDRTVGRHITELWYKECA